MRVRPRQIQSDSANVGDALIWNGTEWAPAPATNLPLHNTRYVDASSTAATPNGSQAAPYLTVADALASFTPTELSQPSGVAVYLAPGAYTETLTAPATTRLALIGLMEWTLNFSNPGVVITGSLDYTAVSTAVTIKNINGNFTFDIFGNASETYVLDSSVNTVSVTGGMIVLSGRWNLSFDSNDTTGVTAIGTISGAGIVRMMNGFVNQLFADGCVMQGSRIHTGIQLTGALEAMDCLLGPVGGGLSTFQAGSMSLRDCALTFTATVTGGSFLAYDCRFGNNGLVTSSGTLVLIFDGELSGVGSYSVTFTGSPGTLHLDATTNYRWNAGPGTVNNGTLVVEGLIPTTERIPTQMVFTEVFKQDWMSTAAAVPKPSWQTNRLQPTGLLWVNDPFTNTTFTRFTTVSESAPMTFTLPGSTAVLTSPATAGNKMSLIYEGTAIGGPQLFTSVRILSRTGTNGAYSAALLGIVKDSNNYIVINYDTVAQNANLQTKVAGTNHFDNTFSLPVSNFPLTLGFSLVGNWITAYWLPESGVNAGIWQKMWGFDVSVYLDFKAQNHALWFAAFGFSTPGVNLNVLTLDDFKVGRFGGVGMRDMCVVTNEDGSPYFTSPTVVKALATLGSPSGGISESSMGVFDIDLEQKTFTQTGVIMVNRGGRVQNDHAGHMIRESNGDQHLSISSWGDSPAVTRIYYKFVPAATDLFTGLNVISSMSQLSLTELPSGGGQYDPFLIFKNGLWYMAYTATLPSANSFYPALDSSSDLTTWSNVGKDSTALQYEGTRILPFNGQSFVLTGGPFNMKMYDLTFTYVGIVNCISPGSGGTQPHAMIFPYQGLDLLVTFDETKWPTSGGLAFSWGSIRWFASPRY